MDEWTVAIGVDTHKRTHMAGGLDRQGNQLGLFELEASERQHEHEILAGENERLDELQQRQLRYADYAWQPPAQGGEKRADDTDTSAAGR